MLGDVRDVRWIPEWNDPLEEGMEMHSSILAWRIPWTEEPGGLQSYSPYGRQESDTTEALKRIFCLKILFCFASKITLFHEYLSVINFY